MHVYAQSLSHVQLFATPWTVACQAPLSVEFSRQEYWSGFPLNMGETGPNLILVGTWSGAVRARETEVQACAKALWLMAAPYLPEAEMETARGTQTAAIVNLLRALLRGPQAS